MAFYTALTREQVVGFIAEYDIGELVDYQGIEGGIENTNYFVTTQKDSEQQTYVLTLFEELGIKELPYFSRLTKHLADQGLSVPAPLRDVNDKAMKVLADRPALLFQKFSGKQLPQVKAEHCQQVGKMLGQIHVKARYFPLMREPHRGEQWWDLEAPRVAPHLSKEDGELLLAQVEEYKWLTKQGWKLPQGTIHGDLFVDNVLFNGDELSAMIDFYNACTGYLLFDLAVAVNDWCVDKDGKIIDELASAFIDAYAAERPFEQNEYKAWPMMLRTAAMRFWLSRAITYYRLEDQQYDAERVIKDPDEYKNILLNHVAIEQKLPELA